MDKEELHEELWLNILDLLGDMWLLDAVVAYGGRQGNYLPEVIEHCLFRLSNYIEQHTDEVNNLSAMLAKTLAPTSEAIKNTPSVPCSNVSKPPRRARGHAGGCFPPRGYRRRAAKNAA